MGFVYFLQAALPPGQPIKIGYSRDPESRARSLSTGYPYGGLRVLLAFPGTIRDERALHRRFAHLRVSTNEWFSPGRDLRRFINDFYEDDAPEIVSAPFEPPRLAEFSTARELMGAFIAKIISRAQAAGREVPERFLRKASAYAV